MTDRLTPFATESSEREPFVIWLLEKISAPDSITTAKDRELARKALASLQSEKERTPAEIGKAIADKLAEHHGPQIEEAARNMAHASVIGLGVGPVPRPSVQSAGEFAPASDHLLAKMIRAWFGPNFSGEPKPTRDSHGEFFPRMQRVYEVVAKQLSARSSAALKGANAIMCPYCNPTGLSAAPAERRTVPGMKWELVEDNPPLNVAQLHTVGELFGIRLVDGCSNGCAELYVEDDGHWHFKMRFDRQWLNDLAFVAKPSSAQNAEGVAGKPVAWRWHWKGGDEPDVWAYSETEVRSNEHQHAEPLYARSATRGKADG